MLTQAEKAQRLRLLHHGDEPLVLVNAWDAISARIIEELGFAAVATTSAGIAYLEGYSDGQQIDRARMLDGVARVTRAVELPVTADLEAGYGPHVNDAIAIARGAIEAGAVGLNFEDAAGDESEALLDVTSQTQRIAAIRETATQLGIALVINARTDVYLRQAFPGEERRLEEAIDRGNRYFEAGADCVFVPDVTDEPTIAKLVRALNGPLNVLAGASTPPVPRLRELGVARISLGSAPIGYVLAQFRAAAIEVRDRGTFNFAAQRIPHAQLNALFRRPIV